MKVFKGGLILSIVFGLFVLMGLRCLPAQAAEGMPALPPQVIEVLKQQVQGGTPVAPPAGGLTGKGVDSPATLPEQQADKGATPDQKGDKGTAPDQKGEALVKTVTPSASSVELRYRNNYSSPFAAQLKQFGYEIFANAQAKTTRLAVPADNYRIGPGDKLRVRVWGSGVDAEYVGVVEKNGTINIPQIGIVDIADVSYGQVEQVIRKESEKYIQGANVNVTLVDLRSVEVYVVGSVPSPSLHLVPAFSTVFDGVLAAGGVSQTGTLRRIELYRDGKLFKHFDLYDLLLHGKRDADLVLQNRDVIFVPRLGQTVAVAGAVKEPAIFELNGEGSAADCLALAGGILPQGYGGKIRLRRYANNQEFVVHDIDTEQDAKALMTARTQDGDLIELVFLSEKMPQVVRLDGNVWLPDILEYKPGMTVHDVLKSPLLLKPDAVTDFALLYRYDSATTRFTPQKITLDDVFQGKSVIPLQPYDRIEVLSREALGIKEIITVNGAVWQPGAKPFSPGLTLGGALALAGGTRFGAMVNAVEVSRQVITNGEAVTNILSLDAAKDAGFALQPTDFILVKEVKEANTLQTVHIKGEVRFPGDYKLADGEHLSQLVQRAGGFLPSAYYYGAKFTSERARGIQQKSIDDMVSRLELQSKEQLNTDLLNSKEQAAAITAAQAAQEKTMNLLRAVKAEGRISVQLADEATFAGSAYDFVLEDADTLMVPKQPNFVSVIGSVYVPNSFHYEPNRSVDYYLKKSGGSTKDADMKGMYLLKANGEVLSKAQSGGLLAWSSFESQVLMPGDAIVVPMNFERGAYFGLIKDISDIIFKIATTAGIAIAALP